MKDDRLYLDHILSRIERIERFTSEGREAFLASDLIQEAVLRCFEVMGEAARKISEDLRQKYAETPWGQMIAVRNILIHNYDNVRLERIWEIIENDVPPLKPQIEAILAQLDAEENEE